MGQYDDNRFLPPGVVRRSSDPFTTGLSRGACGTAAAGIAFMSWATIVSAIDVSFVSGGVALAGAAYFVCGFLSAAAAGCRRGWVGMVCGAVLPALAVGLLLASQPYSPEGSLVALLMLPVLALAGSLVLGSFGFVLKLTVWRGARRMRGWPLLLTSVGVAVALVASGSAEGYFRWGGLFQSCPTGRSCVYEVGISAVVPSGWHAKSPSGDILWEMAWDQNSERVGVMVKRGTSELSSPSPLPTTLDELETAALAQTSAANAILIGNTAATAARTTLPIGEATCIQYERWMFLVDWEPAITDCWFFVDGRVVLVSAVDAPGGDLDTFLQSIRALRAEG